MLPCPAGVQVELCCWVGVDAVKALLGDKMSDAMRKDFERILDDGSAARKAPSRFTRRCSLVVALTCLFYTLLRSDNDRAQQVPGSQCLPA